MAASDAKTPQQHLSELWELLKSYAQQQTVDPLKGLAKFAGLGLGGAVVGGVGVTLLLLGLLRLLQTETGSSFTGNLTWVPYLITLVVAVLLAVAAAAAANRRKERRA